MHAHSGVKLPAQTNRVFPLLAESMAFVPYPSIGHEIKPSMAAMLPESTTWIVTHKYHGTNFMVRVGADGQIKYGRRNGFIADGQGHYNYQEAIKGLDFVALATPFFARDPEPAASTGDGTPVGPAVAVWVYMELYGGSYPGAAKVKGASVVQKGIYYSAANHVKVFDVFVQTAPGPDGETFHGDTDPFTGRSELGYWLPYAEVRARCTDGGIPVVLPVFEGSAADAVAWAKAHAADPAHIEEGMTPIAENGGEGHVVRASVGHFLAKIKNPAWSEISCGKSVASGAGGAVAAGSEPELRCVAYVTPARAAAVFSKMAESDVSMSNLTALVDALKADAIKDMDDVLKAEATEGKTARTFTSACFKVVREALRGF